MIALFGKDLNIRVIALALRSIALREKKLYNKKT
jgi:hypothetical protein